MNNLHIVYNSESVQNSAQTVSTMLDQCAKDMATICNYMPGLAKYLKCQFSHTTCIYLMAHYFLVTKQHNQIMNTHY